MYLLRYVHSTCMAFTSVALFNKAAAICTSVLPHSSSTAIGVHCINAKHENEDKLLYESINLYMSAEDIQVNLWKHVANVKAERTGLLKYYSNGLGGTIPFFPKI